MSSLGAMDYGAIIVYMVLMAILGVVLGKFVHNTEDYFKGGNHMPWLMGGISNFMSLFSTFIFVAYAGIAYEYGIVSLTLLWCTVPAMIAASLLFAKRWRRANIITPVEFLEVRFNATVRQVFTWLGLFFRLLNNMVRLYAIGVFLSTVTPLSLHVSIILAGVIVVVYTIAGGLWAVVVTDAIQFVVLILITLIVIPLSLEGAGGLDNVMNEIPNHFDWFNGPKGEFLFLLAYYVMIILKYNGNWAFIQRFYSVRDEKAGVKMGWFTTILFLVFPVIFLLPPMIAAVSLPGLENPEMAYAAICVEVLPSGLMGLMVAAMFAATMSSLDSEYNVMASVATRDVFQRLIYPKASDRQMLLFGRIATLVLGLVVVFGALYIDRFGGAFEANKLFTGLFAIPMTIPLIGSVLWKRINPIGAFICIVFGLITGLFFNAHPEYSWQLATLIQIGICLAVLWIASFFPVYNKSYKGRTDQFFHRLSTPLSENEKPVFSKSLMISMRKLFAIALATAGGLFIAMVLTSIGTFSSNLTMIAGAICLIGAYFIWPSNLKN